MEDSLWVFTHVCGTLRLPCPIDNSWLCVQILADLHQDHHLRRHVFVWNGAGCDQEMPARSASLGLVVGLAHTHGNVAAGSLIDTILVHLETRLDDLLAELQELRMTRHAGGQGVVVPCCGHDHTGRQNGSTCGTGSWENVCFDQFDNLCSA